MPPEMLLLMRRVVQHATHEHAVFMQVGYYHWLVIMVFFVDVSCGSAKACHVILRTS